MSKIFYNNNRKIIGFGNNNASIQFMLPTPPEFLNEGANIDDIVALNGNHWRKIFVIIAKLCCKEKCWKAYRTDDLLNNVYLNFSTKPQFNKMLNFVCGKTHAQSIGIYKEALTWQAIDELFRVRINKELDAFSIIMTPYLDYRQFPNALIEQVKSNYSCDCSLSNEESNEEPD